MMKKKTFRLPMAWLLLFLLLTAVGFAVAKYSMTLTEEPLTVVIDGRTYVVADAAAFKNNSGRSYTLAEDGTLTVKKVFFAPVSEGSSEGTWYVNRTVPNNAFSGNTEIKSVQLPDSIKTLECCAFYNCTALTDISIQNGLETIDSQAFYGCAALKSVTLPKSLQVINRQAFQGCSALASVSVQEGVTAISASAFNTCTSLTSFTMPKTVTTLGNKAFYGCSALQSITLSTAITKIDERTFEGCHALREITLHEGITEIGYAAFKSCTSFTSISIPQSVASLKGEAFLGCTSIASLTLPDRAIECGPRVFKSLNITTIRIPGNFVIGTNMFDQCPLLSEVTIENGVTVIPSGAFANCRSLTKISFPSTLIEIQSSAFNQTNGIFPLTIPESVTTIHENAFSSSSSAFRIFYYNGTAVGGPWGTVIKHLVVNTKELDFSIAHVKNDLATMSGIVFSVAEDASTAKLLLQTGRNQAVTVDGETVNQFVPRDKLVVDVVDGQFIIPYGFCGNGDVLVISEPKYYSYAVLDGENTLHLYGDQTSYPTAADLPAGSTLYNFPVSMRGNVGIPNAIDGWDIAAKGATRVVVENAMVAEDSLDGWFADFAVCTEFVLHNLDTSRVSSMASMFSGCTSVTSLDLSAFDTTSVTSMASMFNNCSQLTTLDISNFSTSKVTDMSLMFSSCKKITALDLSHFDTKNVTNMRSMFYDCSKLETLDVSSFNTGKVKNMSCMFLNAQSLISLDLSSFNTGNVSDMAQMFNNCYALKSLDVSNFDTTWVTTMYHMFSACYNLESLDLSSFDTKRVTDMISFVYQCGNLKKITVSDKFVTTRVSSSVNMFAGCTALVGGNNTAYISDVVDKTYACIDGMGGQPGYLTGIVQPNMDAASPSGVAWSFGTGGLQVGGDTTILLTGDNLADTVILTFGDGTTEEVTLTSNNTFVVPGERMVANTGFAILAKVNIPIYEIPEDADLNEELTEDPSLTFTVTEESSDFELQDPLKAYFDTVSYYSIIQESISNSLAESTTDLIEELFMGIKDADGASVQLTTLLGSEDISLYDFYRIQYDAAETAMAVNVVANSPTPYDGTVAVVLSFVTLSEDGSGFTMEHLAIEALAEKHDMDSSVSFSLTEKQVSQLQGRVAFFSIVSNLV